MDTTGTKFIVVDPAQTPPQILTEGQRLLEAGDKPRALAYFMTATQLNPGDEKSWLLRAEASEDPEQAAECLEHALAINPDNVQARAKLVALQVSALQAEAKNGNNAPPAPERKVMGGLVPVSLSNRRMVIGGIVAALAVCVLLGIAVPLFAILSSSNPGPVTTEAAPENNAPAQAAVTLPPTWTPTSQPTPTNTPLPTPTPMLKTKSNSTLRSGPGTGYSSLGTLPAGRTITIVARSADGKYYQIQYPDAGKLAWILADAVDLGGAEAGAIPVAAAGAPPPPPPATKAPVKPTDTPVPPYDYALGRGIEYYNDCAKPWKVMGSVYDSLTSAQRVNGVLVRVSANGVTLATLTTGSQDGSRPGYWEWTFSSGSEVVGEVAVVGQDGRLRSTPVGFHLSSRCDGASAVTQMIIDFVGKR